MLDRDIARRRVDQMKNALKQSYVKDLPANCASDPKGTWRELKKLWPSKSKGTQIISLNGKSDPTIMADMMNSHFARVGAMLADEIPEPNIEPWDVKDIAGNVVFHSQQITEEEVLKLLLDLQPSKSCGLHGWFDRTLA